MLREWGYPAAASTLASTAATETIKMIDAEFFMGEIQIILYAMRNLGAPFEHL